ncbi:hypothetical protein BDF20DRAFT_839885 [Mycotypha africana]|uniref:uncharacterized protein n=1 Tax=Mycotypha africana TaxID=64632 RepID=UPI0023005205|nr:uncharacterized protein BDF20DRAFT_839885 [Mycotypha africana]KAI8967672.1 hypothetical protein BDF20DRAFT_839885 [Mycotypha africana]
MTKVILYARFPTSYKDDTDGSEEKKADIPARVDNNWTFEAGQSQLLGLGLEAAASQWAADKVLVPDARLLVDDKVCMLPVLLTKGGASHYCYITANMLIKSVTPKKGTLRGRLTDATRDLELVNNRLYRRPTDNYPFKREVVKALEILAVMQQRHNHLHSGHQSVEGLFFKLLRSTTRSGCYNTVGEYVASCHTCQHYGPRNTPT